MKKSFTMLELIFVIVVIGILSATILPKTKSNSLEEAATQVISLIRYTQHLAMVDDRYDKGDDEWYKERWQFIYGKSKNTKKADTGNYNACTIFSDYKGKHTGNPDITEIALSPENNIKYLSGGYSGTLDWEDKRASKKLNLGYSYGITKIKYSDCKGKRISFDNLGRPYVGNDKNWDTPFKGILTKNCKIILYKGDKSITIYIEKETGYAKL